MHNGPTQKTSMPMAQVPSTDMAMRVHTGALGLEGEFKPRYAGETALIEKMSG